MQPPVDNNAPDLLLRVRQGDASAFAQLYDQYAGPLVSFAAARLQSLDEARDIVQDLFVHFWQERENININLSVKAYLYAAVRYRVIDHIRKNSTRKKYADKIRKLADVTLTTEEELYAKELQVSLHKAVEELTPRLQEVFKLSRFQHLTTSQIAEQLQTSEQTVKNQLSAALGQLRSKLARISFILWWL